MAEALKLPKDVVDSDWKDDIDIDYETYGTEKEEMEYVAPESVSKESIEKIKSIDLRKRLQEIGRKAKDIYTGEKIAA